MSLETLDAPRRALRGGEAADELALFHRTLAEMCRQKLPLPKALRILGEDLGRGRLGREIESMAKEVEQGMPLAEALVRREFPELYTTLVESGSEAGDLPAVLDEIAQHASTRAQVAERLRKALAYPLLAACFVIVTGLFLIGFVSPALSGTWLFGSSPLRRVIEPPPDLTLWVALGISVLTICVVTAFAWLRRPLDFGPKGFALRLPLIGRLRLYAAKTSFARTLALVLRRRLPLPKALSLAAAASDDRDIGERIARMLEAAEEGAGLSEAVRAGALIPPSLVWLVEASEGAGNSAAALDEIAEIYQRRLGRAVDRITVLATPLAELVVGLVLLGLVLCYVFPTIYFFQRIMSFD